MIPKETIIKNTAGALLLLLLLTAALFMVSAKVNGHFDSIDSFRSYLERFGIWGPLVLTAIQAIQVVLPVLPGFLGCIVGAVIFGSAKGFWINYIGISGGSLIAYWLAKRYGVTLVERMVPMEKYRKWIDWVNKKESYTVVLFLMILLPLAPDDFFCYFSGLMKMSAKKFTAIIVTAKPWCILFYSIFFAYWV